MKSLTIVQVQLIPAAPLQPGEPTGVPAPTPPVASDCHSGGPEVEVTTVPSAGQVVPTVLIRTSTVLLAVLTSCQEPGGV